jgi:hypothetical protein
MVKILIPGHNVTLAYPSGCERVYALLGQQDLHDVFSGMHRGDVKSIVVVLQKTLRNLAL